MAEQQQEEELQQLPFRAALTRQTDRHALYNTECYSQVSWKIMYHVKHNEDLHRSKWRASGVLQRRQFFEKMSWYFWQSKIPFEIYLSSPNSVTRLGIFWTLGNFLKPLVTINLSKSLTFLGNFCKGVKIYHFSSEILFGQLL